MKKTLNLSPTVCAALIMTLIAIPAMAQQLSGNETRGTQLSAQWQHGPGVVARGPDGKVIFLFGEVQPSVVCSPLQVCDIELQPGEIVRDVLLGDTVRWKVEPATSGAPNGQAVHLIVKPSEAGLVTSMVVTVFKAVPLISRTRSRLYMPVVVMASQVELALNCDKLVTTGLEVTAANNGLVARLKTLSTSAPVAAALRATRRRRLLPSDTAVIASIGSTICVSEMV